MKLSTHQHPMFRNHDAKFHPNWFIKSGDKRQTPNASLESTDPCIHPFRIFNAKVVFLFWLDGNEMSGSVKTQHTKFGLISILLLMRAIYKLTSSRVIEIKEIEKLLYIKIAYTIILFLNIVLTQIQALMSVTMNGWVHSYFWNVE